MAIALSVRPASSQPTSARPYLSVVAPAYNERAGYRVDCHDGR